MTSFGGRLKIAREHAKLTQGELAAKISMPRGSKMTQGQISKLELGDRQNSTRTVALAEACGVRAAWLESGQGPMVGLEVEPSYDVEQPPTLKLIVSEPNRELERIIAKLTPERVLQLLKSVEGMAVLQQGNDIMPASSSGGTSMVEVTEDATDGNRTEPEKRTKRRGTR